MSAFAFCDDRSCRSDSFVSTGESGTCIPAGRPRFLLGVASVFCPFSIRFFPRCVGGKTSFATFTKTIWYRTNICLLVYHTKSPQEWGWKMILSALIRIALHLYGQRPIAFAPPIMSPIVPFKARARRTYELHLVQFCAWVREHRCSYVTSKYI